MTTLNVFTWNVNFKGAEVIDALRDLKLELDVVTLQEVTNDHVGDFKEALAGLGLTSFHHSGSPGSTEKRYGNVIASRQPLKELPLEGTALPFPQLVAHATVAGVHFITVHAPNGSKNGWDKIDTLAAVRRMVEGSAGPVVVSGDFNEPRFFSGVTPVRSFAWKENWDRVRDNPWTRDCADGRQVTRPRHEWDDAVRWFFEKDLRHAYWAKRGDREVAVTHLTSGAKPERWFDHIFVSSALKVLDCEYHHGLRESRASDHSGLSARLRRG